MTVEGLADPILHSPFDAPDRHFVLGPDGPTGEIAVGRRPSTSWVPIPPQRKGSKAEAAVQAAQAEALTLELAGTGERIETNTLINDIRQRVELWRANNFAGVTPTSRKLLEHWAAGPPVRDQPVLWCQREAAETAIYLAEVAGRKGEPDFRRRVDEYNVLHNDGLPRVALKMATGSGKTVVMAMLIAWQTLNKLASPNDVRFAKQFLVVTPGITIRDRLRVLKPADAENYYDLRDLVPPDLRSRLREARVEIVNYHAFLPRTAKELQGVSATTRRLLTGGADPKSDQFVETDAEVVARVLKPLTGGGGGRARGRGGEVVVFSDEAHHCYQNKLVTGDDAADKPDAEARKRNEDARVWFRGIAAVARHVGVKSVYDLSATPFYLKGSGYNEGFIFPWTVSDFGLMDAIESGIVKIPRIPVDDDAAGEQVTYLHLWDHVGSELPKRKLAKDADTSAWVIPPPLEGALRSLHRSYARSFEHWQANLASHGEPPPVMIVVCPNTTVSRLVHDWIAGHDTTPGHLGLLSNVVDGEPLARPRTVLIDSVALESGDALSADFKAAVRAEIDTFKAEIRLRAPGTDVDALTDEDLLREVMNTVGKPGRLGGQVRCVVSVSMLTEGWDANTVTHILGIRAFGSQLLCEQVVGRGLRRRSYALDERGRFTAEYAQVYGVPFAFIPGDGGAPGDPRPAQPAAHVHALPERAELAITFPALDGYRLEVPDDLVFGAFDDPADRYHIERGALATWVQSAGIVGEAEEVKLDELRDLRPATLSFELAGALLRRFEASLDDPGAKRPWLFPQLLGIAKRWIDECVTLDPDTFIGLLATDQGRAVAAERIHRAIVRQDGNRRGVLRPMIRTFDPQGSTADVDFVTRKKVKAAFKSHVNLVTLDSGGGTDGGNTWEAKVADLCEADDRVWSYVKNDGLGLRIPYVHKGRSHFYVPDFLVRLTPERDGDVPRTLIVEVSGTQKSPGPTAAKASTARDQWCVAVNNHGGWGRWGYVELAEQGVFGRDLGAAIEELYRDAPSATTAREVPRNV
jgi:type III restriction enzyme